MKMKSLVHAKIIKIHSKGGLPTSKKPLISLKSRNYLKTRPKTMDEYNVFLLHKRRSKNKGPNKKKERKPLRLKVSS